LTTPPNILLLGGTAEARLLAAKLKALCVNVTVSLAGVTTKPASYHVPTRRGGFGGVDGLADYVQAHRTTHLINATHPFAAQMTENVERAANQTGTLCLHLRRPPWQAQEKDNWQFVLSLEAAEAALPSGAVAFLATGSGSASAFSSRSDINTVLRVIEGRQSAPPNRICITARPPFSLEDEIETFRTHAITHLVCKNSGGEPGKTKLEAARQLKLPVIMVDRPLIPEGAKVVETVAEASDWVTTVSAP
jgi:precorrin-6A/cobalt-precorrin-6A reductase